MGVDVVCAGVGDAMDWLGLDCWVKVGRHLFGLRELGCHESYFRELSLVVRVIGEG